MRLGVDALYLHLVRFRKLNKIHCTKKFSKPLRFLFISVPVVVFRENLTPRIKADI